MATVTTLLWREPMMILLPERHALAGLSCISERDLTGARVLATAGQGLEPLGLYFQVLARQGRLTLVSSTVERDTLAGLVALGEGVAFVGRSSLSAYYPGIVARPFRSDSFTTDVRAFVLDEDWVTPETKALIATVSVCASEARMTTR